MAARDVTGSAHHAVAGQTVRGRPANDLAVADGRALSQATSVPPTLRDRRRAELRDRIVAAALRLFAERGFDAVTVEEIAAAAGISLSTLFRHVPGKDDLLVDVVRTGRALIVATFEQRPATEPASQSLAHAILRRTEQFADETGTIELWRRAMASAPERIRRAALLDEAERGRLTGLVAARLTALGGSAGSADPGDPGHPGDPGDPGDPGHPGHPGDPGGDDLTSGVLVQVMLAAAEYAYQYWLSQPGGPSLHQLTRRALAVASSQLPAGC
jgi:AcrR family transcriptional regulator